MVLLGAFLVLLLVEGLLRAGGAAYLFFQDLNNRESPSHLKTFRILCLGESTTAFGGKQAYPAQLENVLNESTSNAHFEVINKGVPAATSHHINFRLKKNLERYKPDIVVTMLGVNDHPYGLTLAEQDEGPLVEFLRTLKITELFIWLYETVTGEDKTYPRFEIHDREKKEKLDVLEEKLRLRLAEDPGNTDILLDLALNLREQGKNEAVLEAVKAALEQNPESMPAHHLLGNFYRYLGDYQKSEQVLLNAIEDLPPAWPLYNSLAATYRNLKNYDACHELLQEGIKKFPNAYWLYVEQAFCYRDQLKFKEAAAILETAIQIEPDHAYFGPYVMLGRHYKRTGQTEKSRRMFEHALKLVPNSKWIHYEFQTEYGEKLLERTLNPYTQENYQAIAQKILDAGIPLFAAQYPMLSLERLKQTLSPLQDRIIFVDNEESFKRAVDLEGYYVYFLDRFGGLFGHATPKGNLLLAQNIAAKILDYLKKSGQIQYNSL